MTNASGASTQSEETILVGDRHVVITNPGKVLFPLGGHTKRDVVQYFLSIAEGALRGSGDRPNVLVRYPNGIDGEFFYQKRAPQARPSWVEVATIRFPSGRSAEEVVPRHAADSGVDGESCLPRAAPASRTGCGSGPSRRTAHRPGSGRRRCLVASARGRERRPHRPRGSRAVRVAEDVGQARPPCARPHRASMDARPGAARRARAGSRSRATRAEARHQQVVEGRASRRVHRLQPERQGSHRCRRVLDTPRAGCACFRAARLERSRRRRPGGFHDRHDAEAFRDTGRSARDIDAIPYSLDSLLELSKRHERDGLGDAPWPPQYAKRPDEPARVQPSRRAGVRASAAKAAATSATSTTADPAPVKPRRPRKPSSTRKAS